MFRKSDNQRSYVNRLKETGIIYLEKLNVFASRLKGWPGWARLKQDHFPGGKSISGYLKEINWKSRKMIAAGVIVAVAVVSLGVYLNSTAGGYALAVNGQRVAVLKTRAEAENALRTVLAEKGKPAGQIAFTKDQVTFDPVRAKEYELSTEGAAEKALGGKLNLFVKGYIISANGNNLFTLASMTQADAVLQKLKDNYALASDERKIESVNFEEKVAVTEADVKPEQVSSSDKVLADLLKGQVSTVNYTIQSGDTLWTIARRNDMMIQDLVNSNPGLSDQALLQIGQTMSIVKVQPYLNVIVNGTETRQETIPYSTVYRTDYSLGPGQSKVVAAGSNGMKLVNVSFTSKNGDTTNTVALSETVQQNPVNKVVARGAGAPKVQVAMASRGSGVASGFIWPLHGPIASPFGYRHGRLHTGIDIDAPTGTPYVAALSGTVIAAQWDGGYGKMILVDHGNGVVTRYAHSSAFLVSVGQHVSQGQPIGRVGTTGNTTGPHLHFEIILNGTPVNPLNYL